jgi:hypothetical protein
MNFKEFEFEKKEDIDNIEYSTYDDSIFEDCYEEDYDYLYSSYKSIKKEKSKKQQKEFEEYLNFEFDYKNNLDKSFEDLSNTLNKLNKSEIKEHFNHNKISAKKSFNQFKNEYKNFIQFLKNNNLFSNNSILKIKFDFKNFTFLNESLLSENDKLEYYTILINLSNLKFSPLTYNKIKKYTSDFKFLLLK